VNHVRVFLDSCVLVEGVCSAWSASRAVLILGRSPTFKFVLAELVIEETQRALTNKLSDSFGGSRRLREDFAFLLTRLNPERVPHVTDIQFLAARSMIRHTNDVPILAAAIQAKPDWLLTDNTAHFDDRVSEKSGLRIATPQQFLNLCGKLFR
jgi:predicted nucleic acid-binding protein